MCIYDGAIRNNVGDVDGMICHIDAVFFHCLSTDLINFVPLALTVGASITGLKPKMNVLPHIILKSQEIWLDMYVLFYLASQPRPIIKVRGDPKSKRIIQPYNVGKTQFLSKPIVKFAVHLSVIVFNEGIELGMSVILKGLGVEPGPRVLSFFKNG